MTAKPNYDDFVLDATDDQLSSIHKLATQAIDLAKQITEQEDALDALRAQHKRIVEATLPQAMLEAGMQSFKTSNGNTVTLKDNVFASITKVNEPVAFTWLRDNGHGSLIKNKFEITFTKQQDNMAVDFEEDLKQRGVDYKRTEAVHASSLRAFVKEQLERGTPLPLTTFSVHVQQEAIIK